MVKPSRWDPRGAFEARDLGSLNGTIVNGVRMSAERTPSGWAELKGAWQPRRCTALINHIHSLTMLLTSAAGRR